MQKEWLTPPEVARSLRIRREKIRDWIDRGDLRAVNVADGPAGQPRYRIHREWLGDFLDRRSPSPPPTSPQPRRAVPQYV